MNKLFGTGDTHGDFFRFSSTNFQEGKNLTKSDFVIIFGDFGGIWDLNKSSKEEKHWIDWLTEKPWTTLFLDGNHENFDRLNRLPTIDFLGDEVGVVSNSIFHLKRGRVYTIGEKTFFTMGGAYSFDKERRKEFIDWWKEEIPSFSEQKLGLENLKKYNNSVDYIISHTCSKEDFNLLGENYKNIFSPEDSLREYLQTVVDTVDHEKRFFGHFHEDKDFGKVRACYKDIFEII